MKAEWKEFLALNGAEWDDGTVASFGNPGRECRAALGGNVFADLSHMGLIAAHGEDAASFLHGQFSNDVLKLGTDASHLSSLCSPKGRMLANFRLFRRGDSYYLRLPAALVETALGRLRMFVLRAAVTLEDAGEDLMRLGVSGPDAEEEVNSAAGVAPDAVDAVAAAGELTVIRVPGVQPRFEIYGPLEPMRKVWETLNVRCAPVGAGPWRMLEILAGIPTVYPPTSDAFVPQMANMELVGGVSFKKGCYPGQEVVARMQYLGKLKRRMYLGRIATDGAVGPGDELFSEGSEQPVGRVVDAQPHPDGGRVALAVITITDAEAGRLRLGSPEGPEMRLEELPYPLETAG